MNVKEFCKEHSRICYILIGMVIVLMVFFGIHKGYSYIQKSSSMMMSGDNKIMCELEVQLEGKGKISYKLNEEEKIIDESQIVSIPKGTSVELIIQAGEKNKIVNIILDGEEQIIGGEDKSAIGLRDIKESHKLQIHFKECRELNIGCGENGSLKIGDRIINGGEVANLDVFDLEKKIIVVLPQEGYRIKYIQMNQQMYDDSIIVLEDKDLSLDITDVFGNLQIEFEQITYRVLTTSNKGGSITCSNGKESMEVAYNENCEISIVLDSPIYEVKSVKVNGEDIFLSELIKISLVEFQYTIKSIYEDVDIELEYQEIECREGKFSDYVEVSFPENILKIYDETKDIYYINNLKSKYIELRMKNDSNQFIYGKAEACDWVLIFRKTQYLYKISDLEHIVIKDKDNKIFYLECQNKIIVDDTPPSIKKYRNIYNMKEQLYKIIVEASDSGRAGISLISFGTKEEYMYYKMTNKIKSTYTFEHKDQDLYQAQIPLPVDPTEQYYIWAIDNANNISAPYPVDLIGPEVTVETESNYTNKEIKVKGSITDNASEITNVFYSSSQEAYENHIYSTGGSKLVKEATLNSEHSKYSFTIPADSSSYQKYYIWGYDCYGNKTSEPGKYTAKIDLQAPEVTIVSKEPSEQWTNSQVTILVKASDGSEKFSSGIKEVCYKTRRGEIVTIPVSEIKEGMLQIKTPLDEKGAPVDLEEQYTIWAVDVVHNISEKRIVDVAIDTKAPIIKKLTIQLKEKEQDLKGCDMLGIYVNQPIEIEVLAEDLGIASGVCEIVFYQNDLVIEKKKVDDQNRAKFTLEEGFDGEISFQVIDQVGNQSKRSKLSEIQKEFQSSTVVVEKEKPEITLHIPDPVYIGQDNQRWYQDATTVTIHAKDQMSGVKKIWVCVNGREKRVEKVKTIEKEVNLKVPIGEKNDGNDGAYQIELRVEDLAGNIKTIEETIFVDRKMPVIEHFTFEAKGVKEGQEGPREQFRYGYYFTEKTKVTIYAKDEGESSGLCTIEYYVVDYSRKKEGEKSKVRHTLVDREGKISFELPEHFKGQIFARAFDNVQNATSTMASPYGVIIEAGEEESKSAKIQFEKSETDNIDITGKTLYSAPTYVGFIVEDSFSGIKKIEWTVRNELRETTECKAVTIDQNGVISGDVDAIIINERDTNLVTKLQGTLTVDIDANDTSVVVKVTDRANRCLQEEIKVSIDKSKPVGNVSFEGEYLENQTYFKTSRVAKIVINERNFNREKMRMQVFSDTGATAVVGEWKESRNLSNPDHNFYTATITFDADGEYHFIVEGEDAAGNVMEPIQVASFVIDQTAPKVEVQFLDTRNDLYFNSKRVAIVTVQEVNFSRDDITVVGTALNGTKTGNYPHREELVQEGTTHKFQIVFEEDAAYTLQVEVKDLAGNLAVSEKKQFVIDQQVPRIEISGVKDQVAYTGKLVPIISVTDEYYDKTQVGIQIVGSRNDQRVYEGENRTISNGENFIYSCFPEKEEFDDIYTMKVRAVDLAGNEATQTITFSLNRFGSSYLIQKHVQQKLGAYYNQPFDVLVTEINPNQLDETCMEAKLIYNGEPKALKSGAELMISALKQKDGWYQYDYCFKKELFENEGFYQIYVYSKDVAGNVNETIGEGKKADITFGIDKTPPVTIPLNIETSKTYGEEQKVVSFSVTDNLVLDQVQIYLDDELIAYEQDKDIYTFVVPSKNRSQVVKVVATDAAGNRTEERIDNFYVTTSVLLQWFTNTPLFVGSVAMGFITLIGGVSIIIIYKRKKCKKRKNFD